MSTIIEQLERARTALNEQSKSITQALQALRGVKALTNGGGTGFTRSTTNGANGMSGNAQMRARVSAQQTAYWGKMSPEERSKEGTRRLRRAAKHGRGLFARTWTK